MSTLALPLSLDDLELAFLKEQYLTDWGKTGKAIRRRNLVRNPGAEVNSTEMGVWAGAANTRITVNPISGVGSFQSVCSGAQAGQGIGWYCDFAAASAYLGKNIRGQAKLRLDSGTSDFELWIRVTYTDTTFYETARTTVVITATANTFYTAATPYVIAGGKTVTEIQLMCRSKSAIAATIVADDVMVEFSDAPTVFFSGASANDNVFTREWTGTPNSSSSIEWSAVPYMADGVTPDYVAMSHSTLEREWFAKTSGLTPKEQYSLADHRLASLRNTVQTIAGDPLDTVRRNLAPDPKTTDIANYATTAAATRAIVGNRLEITATGTSVDSFTSVSGDTGGIRLGMKPGKTYTISANLEVVSGFTVAGESGSARSILAYVRTPSTGYAAVASAKIAPGASGRLSRTVTLPEDCSEAFVRLFNGSNVAGDKVYWSDILIEEGDAVNPFFYGGDAQRNTRWAGVANNSVSELVDFAKQTVSDLWMSYLMGRSGLTPVTQFTLSDHERKTYQNALGL